MTWLLIAIVLLVIVLAVWQTIQLNKIRAKVASCITLLPEVQMSRKMLNRCFPGTIEICQVFCRHGLGVPNGAHRQGGNFKTFGAHAYQQHVMEPSGARRLHRDPAAQGCQGEIVNAVARTVITLAMDMTGKHRGNIAGSHQ